MKVSTKGRYGLKAIIDLAISSQNGDCISLKSIAQRQGISESYLEQLISQLKRAGLVMSLRGAYGGYRLAKKPGEISVGDVLRVLEGSLSPVDCIESGQAACGTGDCSCCSTKSVWGRMYTSLNAVVDSISIEELMNDEQSRIDLAKR